MQFAKSQDLMKWEQISNSVSEDTLFENIREELAEEFEYAQTDTLWASDIQQFKNGKYYLYYCLCQGTSPLSVMGVAVSDSIEGPYEKVESFFIQEPLRSLVKRTMQRFIQMRSILMFL